MLQDRSILEKALQNRMVAITSDKTFVGLDNKKDIIKNLYDNYNIPIDLSSDILNLRRALSEVSLIVVFAIADEILHKNLGIYFTKEEIETYRNIKYDLGDKIDTITFKMIQVSDDQWIGATDVKTLMNLRNNQMIHYNGDTQRALQHVIRHGNEILQPYLNLRAVTSISEQYQKGNFIPNTITLNLPEDADITYSDRTNELTIYNIEYFDITDGYHRYVAMGNVFDNTKDFNYPVELRITKFSTIRAQQFIYQEDQKTKMRQVDSKYYNSADYGNMIVRKLDEDSNLRGKINNKDGVISAPFLAEVINKIWKPKSNKEVIVFTKDIRQRLNSFTEEYTDYLENTWSKIDIITIFYGFYREISIKHCKDFVEFIKEKHPDIAKASMIKKKDINTLEKGVNRYV